MEPVHQPLQADVQVAETGQTREQGGPGLRADTQTPFQRLLESPGTIKPKPRLRQEHALVFPFELKKSTERKLKSFFTVLGNLKCESMKS
jgi:hypothetical protein